MTVLASTAARVAALTLPTAPKSTLVKERFIARLMRMERKKPEAPSRAPAMISTLLLMAKPVAAAASPA